eukprot:TRINITY_DN37630_c0_g1_i1.p1 TRINITY_DN37630_c0_g1~~TRINITY_DN37630_c0_g1_i1.p1  ORF type:complete len:363 (-),score=8.32 TRINITY_DN37630_c0_g1_i1:1-1089(-)
MLSVFQALLSTVLVYFCECFRQGKLSSCSDTSRIFCNSSTKTSKQVQQGHSPTSRRFQAAGRAVTILRRSKVKAPKYLLRDVTNEMEPSRMQKLIEHEKNGFLSSISRDQKVVCQSDYSHIQVKKLHALRVNEGLVADADGKENKTYYRFYHGTSETGVNNIIQNGIKAGRNNFWRTLDDGHNLVGAGLYLSTTVLKADQYSTPVQGESPSLFPMLLIGVDAKIFDNRVFLYLWHGSRHNEYFAFIHGERVLHHGKSKLLKHLRKTYKGRMIQVLAFRNHWQNYKDRRRELTLTYENNGHSLPATLKWEPIIQVFDEFVFTADLIERIFVDRTLRLEYVVYYNRCKKTNASVEGCDALQCGS